MAGREQIALGQNSAPCFLTGIDPIGSSKECYARNRHG